VFAPDERDLLLRFCVWPRLRHFLRNIPPDAPIADVFASFDAAVVDARLAVAPSAAQPVHIDPRRLSSLPGRFGGHGTMPHTGLWWDSAYYGSFAAVWHFSRAWCGPLRGAQLAQAGQGRHLTALQAAWDRIAEAHTRMQRRGDLAALLPDDAHFPEMHSRLQHGRVSPASVPLGQLAAGGLDDDSGDSPSLLYDLDSCDTACHRYAQRAASHGSCGFA